jgi:hypothetical protein
MRDISQEIWDEYYSRIKRRRLRAAELLWGELEAAGVNEETILVLDFVHNGNNRDGVESLARQLSEFYSMEISEESADNYFDVKGTTRPDGICLTQNQHTGWVEFMLDVAQSYACVFSDWTLEAPMLGQTFQSAHLDDD